MGTLSKIPVDSQETADHDECPVDDPDNILVIVGDAEPHAEADDDTDIQKDVHDRQNEHHFLGSGHGSVRLDFGLSLRRRGIGSAPLAGLCVRHLIVTTFLLPHHPVPEHDGL
ncbi:hypothetical protein PMAYCL1PPCAC_27798, partial [Pristionchus mayeri]